MTSLRGEFQESLGRSFAEMGQLLHLLGHTGSLSGAFPYARAVNPYSAYGSEGYLLGIKNAWSHAKLILRGSGSHLWLFQRVLAGRFDVLECANVR